MTAPQRARRALLSPYHLVLAALAALYYGFPARGMTVIGITGTKGKSSAAEMLHVILAAAGHKAALAGTIRFAVGEESRPNLFKMTLPGRGFIQKFLAEARAKGATHAIVEITSEAALQWRHLFLDLDALVFTNLQPEHLESHGSMEQYFNAKFRIVRALLRSPKRPRAIIANADDPFGARFLAAPAERRLPFSFSDAQNVSLGEVGVSFGYDGVHFDIPQPGRMSVMNALPAIRAAEFLGVPPATSARALAALARIPGRVERIEVGQNFLAVVDYAHTPDSLKALYGAFPNHRKICVLGNTGGGRDRWKRPEMGEIASEACAEVFLTNEDPYDEDPRAIVEEMARAMRHAPRIVMDRREAIRAALRLAASWTKSAQPLDFARGAGNQNVAVLISGKGTDPFIMGPKGSKEPWSDAAVIREEWEKLKRGGASGTM